MAIQDAISLMRENKIARLVLDGARVEIEMHPCAFLPPPSDDATVPDRSDQCACGHGLTTEHSETGCFHGCSVDLCNTTAEVTSG